MYECLEKSDRPLSRTEIAKATGISQAIVSRYLRSMLKYNEVTFVEIDRVKVKEYCYRNGIPRVKQRMRLYIVVLD